MASECKFNIAVQTLHVQQLTPKGLLVIYVFLYIKLSHSKHKYAAAKNVIG